MTYMFKVIHYCLQMFMKTLEICVLINMDLTPVLAWVFCFKKTGIKLELLTYYNMILMI